MDQIIPLIKKFLQPTIHKKITDRFDDENFQ